jgi:hypothetical protein
MNQISLDLTNPDLAPLAKKKAGEECTLSEVTIVVTANDGETLTGDITEAALGDEYDEGYEDRMSGKMPGKMSDKGKPIAVIAIGMGKKK